MKPRYILKRIDPAKLLLRLIFTLSITAPAHAGGGSESSFPQNPHEAAALHKDLR